MGSKKTLPVYYPFQAQAVSSTTTYTSPDSFIGNLDNIGVQVRFVGTQTGTFSVQVSNDGINFDDLTFSPALSQPAGSNLSYAIDLNQIPWAFLGFKYINASGSGVLNVSIFGKDVN